MVGGVAVLDSQRQVLLTLTGTGEAGKNFVITGTDEDGATISETIAGGAAGTFPSVRSYKTVTRITISANAANALTVGTNTVGDSQWQLVNTFVSPVNLGLAVTITGSVNFTVSYTYDDPSRTFPGGNPPTAFDFAALATKAANTDGGLFNIPVTAIRLRINSGTGTAVLAVVQAGVLNG